MAFEQKLNESIQSKQTITLAFIDLDKFKAINDTHGHEAGDAVLIKVAEFLSGQKREAPQSNAEKYDLAARIGGDEFVILFNGADAETLNARATEIEKDLNKLSIIYNGIQINIGGSVGIFNCPLDMNPDECLKKADEEMYKIKEAKHKNYQLNQTNLTTSYQGHPITGIPSPNLFY